MKTTEDETLDASGAMCSRWKINSESKGLLEREFNRKRFPSPRSKKRLADELDVEPRRIQVWFQNRRQREKVGPEHEAQRPSELKSSLERFPPREPQAAFVQTGYGTPSSSLSPMRGSARLREVFDDGSTLPDGNYARLPEHRLPKCPRYEMPQDFSSHWGDSVASKAYKEAYGGAPLDFRQDYGRFYGHARAPNERSAGRDAMGGRAPTMTSILNSSDDIVHALMEFEGAPAPFNSCDDFAFAMPHAGLQPSNGSEASLSNLADLWQYDSSAPVGGVDGFIGIGEVGGGSFAARGAAVAPVAPGVDNLEEAEAALQAAASADYSSSHLRSILSACRHRDDQWKTGHGPACENGQGAVDYGIEQRCSGGIGDIRALGGHGPRQHAHEPQSRLLLPGQHNPTPSCAQMHPCQNAQWSAPSVQQEPRKDIDSWVHAADMVNAVLSTARQQYAVATGRQPTSDRRVQADVSGMPTYDSFSYPPSVPVSPMPQMLRPPGPGNGPQMDLWGGGSMALSGH